MRCPWCGEDELYVAYHDTEWGVPVVEDHKQFEFLVLESAQAGLSWITILRRREHYREAYDGFDPKKVARYDEAKIELLNNEGIIRNRKKIEASVNNARHFLAIQEEWGTFANYLWHYVDYEPIAAPYERLSDVPAYTELSETIAKDLKKRGFRFLGPTIIYAHLQAAGLINDHLVGCFRRDELLEVSRGMDIRVLVNQR